MRINTIGRKQLFKNIIIYLIVSGLLGTLCTYLKLRSAGIIIMVIMLIPVIFIHFLIKFFTKKLDITLSENSFTIDTIQHELIISTYQINLSDILFYTIQYPNDRFCSIKFELSSGAELEYSFFQKKQISEEIDGINIIEKFVELISNYNSHSNVHKIALKPSFYASSKGKWLIRTLSVILIFCILFASSFNAKTIPFTFFFSAILIMQMILKRKKDIALYKSLKG
jgi:hypothetical protein